MIAAVDEFILYDDMQYTRRDWRNRNRVKTPNGTIWLTIPVEVSGKYYQKIKDTVVTDSGWGRKHWQTLVHNYAHARYFREYREMFEPLYLECTERNLSAINYRFLVAVCGLLGIQTKLSWSMNYQLMDGKTERLVDLCKQAGATEYLSGPAAKGYIDEELFRTAGIQLRYMDYSGYPEYEQLYPPFEHAVSIVDLIFNVGPGARDFMRSF